MKKTFVWDLPVRLFHWSLVLLICISFYTGVTGGFEIMDYHMWSGYAVLALVLFRISWGFLGGRNARFSSFIKGPGHIMAYLKSMGKGAQPVPGHNPLGALSVVAMLLALLVQAGTGLFANDDIMLEGPLAHLVSYSTSRQLTAIHETNRWIVVALLALHLAAVFYYQVIKRVDIIRPMVTGWMRTSSDPAAGDPAAGDPAAGEPATTSYSLVLAVVLLATSAGFVYYLVTYV